jgi:hypothetical protein
MVILVRSYGNHSNRLFQSLHIEAFCLENNVPFFNATMLDMAHIFKFRYNYFVAVLMLLCYYLTKWTKLFRLLSFNDSTQINWYKQQLLQKGRNHLVFVRGWEFRDAENIHKHYNYFKNKYDVAKINNDYSRIIDIIKRYDLVLGVHVRRGDYKVWLDGKYFYSDSTYSWFANRFIELHKNNKVLIVFFSNDILEAKNFDICSDVIISYNPYYIDYKIMGQCHYLIGPPSTFVSWAALIYQVPFLHVENPEQGFTMEDFGLWKS